MTLQEQLDEKQRQILEYYNFGIWNALKYKYHKISKMNKIKHKQINQGEIWYCDLGYNIGTEKNKMRPVLVISSNKVNRSEKVVILCITDAKNKINSRGLPFQDSWYLLYSSTTDENKKFKPARIIFPNNTPYNFLEKDSVVQCEEIKAVSKARFDFAKGCIGTLESVDLFHIKEKFLRTYDFGLTK